MVQDFTPEVSQAFTKVTEDDEMPVILGSIEEQLLEESLYGTDLKMALKKRRKKKKKIIDDIDLSLVLGIDYKDKDYNPGTDFSSYCPDICSSIFVAENKTHPSIMSKTSSLLLKIVPAIKECLEATVVKYNVYIAHSMGTSGYPDQFVLSIDLWINQKNHSIIIGFTEKNVFKLNSGNEKYKDAADDKRRIPYYGSSYIYYGPEVTKYALLVSKALKKNATGKPSRRDKPTIEMIAVSRDLYTKVIELDFEYDPDENLDIHYGEGFNEFDNSLTQRLEKENKGIVMLYGPPGTGKTHYIRRLISKISKKGSKRIILIPKYILEQIEGPQFNNFMTSNFMDSDALFIIEDAESIISERNQGGDERNSLVSTLLNISDGILNDIFKIQVILTFNTELDSIDKALLRPGRLIAQKNFDPLDKTRAQILVDFLEINYEVEEEMTVAEIYALREEEHDDILLGDMSSKNKNKIGF